MAPEANRAAGLILAAGSSRRMGRPKQLLELGGRPLLEIVVERACASSLDEVVVVLGAAADEIQRLVQFGRARVVVNPDHASGMSSSLRRGLAEMAPEVDRVMVILGDQPSVTPQVLDGLLAAQQASGLPASALSFGGLLHPPVVLARELWGGLAALEGDVGCRAIIRAHPHLVAAVETGEDLSHPVDVDTPEDYERLLAAPR